MATSQALPAPRCGPAAPNLGSSHTALFSTPAQWLLMLCSLLCLLQEVRSWRGDDSPVANGAGTGVHRQRDREPDKEEREEEKRQTSQVEGAGDMGGQSLGDELG